MPPGKPGYQDQFLTPMDLFLEVSRGQPYLLPLEEQRQVGLDPETWFLEISPDVDPWISEIGQSRLRESGTAISYEMLLELGDEKAVRYFKAMQCNNDRPTGGSCSNALWEGVPLKAVLERFVGSLADVRRVFYWGFHKEEKHYFASSLPINRVLDTPPGQLPVFLAYKMNGRTIPVERGGPVRMIVPEAYGFKSIKWIQQMVLTNNYQANDSYALRNNDPDSYMKTVARINVHGPREFEKGSSIRLNGIAMVGMSGLKKIEYWLRPDQGTHGHLEPDDPAWEKASWTELSYDSPPKNNWGSDLPGGKLPDGIEQIREGSGGPVIWPIPYSWVLWNLILPAQEPGTYEFYVRAVDANGNAQPQPRPNRQSGYADIASVQVTVKP